MTGKPMTGTAMVKARARFLKSIDRYPDRAEYFRDLVAKMDEGIMVAGVCKRCGRPLKDDHARQVGYGKECQSKAEAEAAASEEGDGQSSRTDGVRPVGQGHGGVVSGEEGLDEDRIR